MNLTRTAYGTWSGGRYMHFGQALEEDRYLDAIRHAHSEGIRTFITADVYGTGDADTMLGRALADFPSDSFCLVGSIGHDFYDGEREGSKGFPRFTDAKLRDAGGYADYIRKATERSLERCGQSKFDLLMLHNPDSIGYSDETVWQGMSAIKESGLTEMLGVAPGPANGFTLDIISCFEKFHELIDWAMIILNPLEPWPGQLVLPAAEKHGIDILTRVVDYGGLFHDDVKPGHPFPERDHRTFRPGNWVEAGNEKIDKMRPVAEKYGLTMIQLASIWNLTHPPVKSVVPTMIQEPSESSKTIEQKITELANLPDIQLTESEREELRGIGNNQGCMALKGGSHEHEGAPLPDRWTLTPELQEVGKRWGINAQEDLAFTHG